MAVHDKQKAIRRGDFRVLIIGAGLSGLTLAHGLQKDGVSFDVFEKDDSPVARDQGYRIHLDGPSVEAMKACLPDVVFKTFLSLSEPLGRGFSFFDENMRLVAFLARKPDASRAISRFSLRQILLSGLEKHVHFRKSYRSCEFGDDTIRANFADGSIEEGNLLVGADGSKSRVVEELLPAAKALDTGFTAINGKIRSGGGTAALFPASPFDHIGIVVGPKKRLTFLSEQVPPFKNAQLASNPELAKLMDPAVDFSVWSLVIKNDEVQWQSSGEPNGAEILSVARTLAAHGDPMVRRLVESTRPEDVGLAVLWSSPKSNWTTNPAWTVLGDAIHSMVPLRGRGSSAAMIDAQALRLTLQRRFRSPENAVREMAHYEAAMRRRAFTQVRTSRLVLYAARLTGVGRVLFFFGLRIAQLIGNFRMGRKARA